MSLLVFLLSLKSRIEKSFSLFLHSQTESGGFTAVPAAIATLIRCITEKLFVLFSCVCLFSVCIMGDHGTET